MGHKLIAFTGAGISKASGIPTFEDVTGIRDKLTRPFFIEHPQEFWDNLIQMYDTCAKAEPNAAHRALAAYPDVPVITMNVDGLHKRAGSKNVLEIHGNFDFVECFECGEIYPFEQTKQSIYCPKCKTSVLEPNVILYGDAAPKYAIAEKMIREMPYKQGIILIVGTSFFTQISETIRHLAQQRGAKIIINNEKSEITVPNLIGKLVKLTGGAENEQH